MNLIQLIEKLRELANTTTFKHDTYVFCNDEYRKIERIYVKNKAIIIEVE